jgi:hypothetical protein
LNGTPGEGTEGAGERAICDAGAAAGIFDAEPDGIPEPATELGITCVRGFAADGAGGPDGTTTEAAMAEAGFATLGMICVPGIFFDGSGAGGPGGGCCAWACCACAAATAPPTAASNAPRCDRTLLTASGETCPIEGSGFDAGGA